MNILDWRGCSCSFHFYSWSWYIDCPWTKYISANKENACKPFTACLVYCPEIRVTHVPSPHPRLFPSVFYITYWWRRLCSIVVKWDNGYAQQMLATECAGMNVTWYFIIRIQRKETVIFLMTSPFLYIPCSVRRCTFLRAGSAPSTLPDCIVLKLCI